MKVLAGVISVVILLYFFNVKIENGFTWKVKNSLSNSVYKFLFLNPHQRICLLIF